jgi:hypothetical protein
MPDAGCHGMRSPGTPASAYSWTAGHCFIDLVHNSAALDFTGVPVQGRPEAFGPFIRVTNSYNGLRALAFNIGFFGRSAKTD